MTNEISKPSSGNWIDIFHDPTKKETLPTPFGREIFLFYVNVAGTNHIEDLEEITLSIGDRLDFYREPENPFDPKAIVIKTKSGEKIGYVPRKDNVVFARLMDAGKTLFGKISNIKEELSDWEPIRIMIFLED